MNRSDGAPRLAIIGGGLTGAALAAHVLKATRAPLAVEVVDPTAALGRGAAYSTEDPVHRVNVPSHRISLYPDDPGHFTRWLFNRGILPDAASTPAPGEHCVSRAAFEACAGDMFLPQKSVFPGGEDHPTPVRVAGLLDVVGG